MNHAFQDAFHNNWRCSKKKVGNNVAPSPVIVKDSHQTGSYSSAGKLQPEIFDLR